MHSSWVVGLKEVCKEWKEEDEDMVEYGTLRLLILRC